MLQVTRATTPLSKLRQATEKSGVSGGLRGLSVLSGRNLLAEGRDGLHRTENGAKPGQMIADVLVSAALLVFVQIRPWRACPAAPGLRMHEIDDVVVELGIDQTNLADSAVAHSLPHRLHRVAHRVRRCAGEPNALLGGELEHRMRFAHVGHKRLFGIDVLARRKRSTRYREVTLDAGKIGDDGNLGVRKQLLVARVGLDLVRPRDHVAAAGVQIRYALENKAGMARPCRHVMVEDVAAADDANIHIDFRLSFAIHLPDG